MQAGWQVVSQQFAYIPPAHTSYVVVPAGGSKVRCSKRISPTRDYRSQLLIGANAQLDTYTTAFPLWPHSLQMIYDMDLTRPPMYVPRLRATPPGPLYILYILPISRHVYVWYTVVQQMRELRSYYVGQLSDASARGKTPNQLIKHKCTIILL